MGMSLKRERVEHLDHQCELNAPGIINIVICYCYCYCYLLLVCRPPVWTRCPCNHKHCCHCHHCRHCYHHHTWQEYWSPHPRRHDWRQVKCSRCDEPRSASWSTVSGRLPCCAPGDNNVFDWQTWQGASSDQTRQAYLENLNNDHHRLIWDRPKLARISHNLGKVEFKFE